MATRRRLVGKIAFETSAGAVFGDKRIRLLEAIATHGSLNRAAKAVPLSYKAAWDALDAMNNLAEAPLVVRTTGGRNGGGTRLTEHGLRMIALYRAMESSQQDILDRISSPRALAAAADEGASLRILLRRMAVRTSARNQFVGSVVAVEDAGGMADVRMRLDGGEELTASITPESVETMSLVPGGQVYALIKAPWVDVTPAAPQRSRSRNVFGGTITALDRGSVSTRLTLTTPTGRAIAAARPEATVGKRGLKRGDRAWASFATDSVILATYD
jgi:molybdate transport system regulatory protein